jgi:hypothetical protein
MEKIFASSPYMVTKSSEVLAMNSLTSIEWPYGDIAVQFR